MRRISTWQPHERGHRAGGRATGRRVAAVIGSSSPSGALDRLRALVASGLVIAERSTAATFYSVDTERERAA